MSLLHVSNGSARKTWNKQLILNSGVIYILLLTKMTRKDLTN